MFINRYGHNEAEELMAFTINIVIIAGHQWAYFDILRHEQMTNL